MATTTQIKDVLSLKSLFALREGFMPTREFVDAIIQRGVDKVRFLAPLPKLQFAAFGIGVYGSEQEKVECRIIEDRHKVADGYKITLEAIENPSFYATRHFYEMDLKSLIRSGVIEIVN